MFFLFFCHGRTRTDTDDFFCAAAWCLVSGGHDEDWCTGYGVRFAVEKSALIGEICGQELLLWYFYSTVRVGPCGSVAKKLFYAIRYALCFVILQTAYRYA